MSQAIAFELENGQTVTRTIPKSSALSPEVVDDLIEQVTNEEESCVIAAY
ncbi:hypothetical protein [Vibrio alginolyticus]|nr:hypothetical protein [Vibrio alginolyticus]CAH7129115.1 hypothetical protein VCHA51O444_10035 [Vibrio chagasii]CAH7220424.1 hypothetical protein VCHA53O474_240034 [Vibrio chagasii]